LTLALDGVGWSASRPGRFTLRGKVPDTHWTGGGEEKNSQPLPGLEHPFIQPVALCRTAELSQLHHMRGMILNDELGKMGKAWLFQGTVPAFM